tara:strand:- start:1077 stop:1286 length:210 start_codon:yes stop_codon:yes gene_type:complete
MKLHDTTIAHIARIIQLALITGTDIVDHLRMIELVKNESDLLELEENYKITHDKNINEMIENTTKNPEQ